jgi:hypothetical protein
VDLIFKVPFNNTTKEISALLYRIEEGGRSHGGGERGRILILPHSE